MLISPAYAQSGAGSTDFGFRFPSVRKYCTAPKRIAKTDDVLLSVRAPVGDINRAKVECCIGRGLASIRSKYNFQSWTHYRCSFLNREFEPFKSEGTVFGAINGTDLKSLPISLPQIEIIEGFEKLINPLDRKISILSEEILILNKLRDTLLPKLISGELKIPNAENLIKDVGI